MTTLADLKKKVEKDSAARSGGGPRRAYLKLEPGENKRIRFRQELATDAGNYDEERGEAAILRVHTSPQNFRKKALCTKDSEANNFHCWACEQMIDGNKGFRYRERLLINVLALENEEWVPYVMEQAWIGNSNIGPTLAEYTEEYGTIMDRDYKISRQGARLDTKYTLITLKEGPQPEEDEEKEFFSVHDAVRTVPYEEQEAFYNDNEEQESGSNTGWAN